MSYEIYKSVKQLKNGNFEVISTSNNDSPYYWHKWTMTFFNEKFSIASNAEKLACWMLYSRYVGDVFYQKKKKKKKKYKLMQAAAAEFMEKTGYTLDEIKKLFAGYVTANPEFVQC